MAKNIKDRRVQKTRKFLQDALIELIEEKGYESVTVQQIIDKANVGRSTFYSHFDYKDQLLHSCFDDIAEVFEFINKRFSMTGKAAGDNDFANPILRLFEFVGRNHRFFKALIGKRNNGVFNKYFYDYMFALMHEHLNIMSHEKRDTVQSEIVAHYVVSAFIGILIWWVDNDMPLTSEEMAAFFRQSAMHGFRDTLQLNH